MRYSVGCRISSVLECLLLTDTYLLLTYLEEVNTCQSNCTDKEARDLFVSVTATGDKVGGGGAGIFKYPPLS